LATIPIRLKNFAVLEIGRSFVSIKNGWWIVLNDRETKEERADERPVPGYLLPWVERYLRHYRPTLDRSGNAPTPLWLSSNDGTPLTYDAVGRIISQTSLATVGGGPELAPIQNVGRIHSRDLRGPNSPPWKRVAPSHRPTCHRALQSRDQHGRGPGLRHCHQAVPARLTPVTTEASEALGSVDKASGSRAQRCRQYSLMSLWIFQ
jgi:hypothetical protein